MVNFLHNITALAGAATVCRIFDFKNGVMSLAGGLGDDGIAIGTGPLVGAGTTQEWVIIPQATAGTFTLQSVGQPAAFVSYAAAAKKVPGHSQTVASDTASNMALTAWANADPATFTFQGTPLTMEAINVPHSFMQSFTIALCRYFSAHRLVPDTELKYSDLNSCMSDPSEIRNMMIFG
ncbi:hypothetical protein B0H13DRAFT_1890103 [Mycena leptocephala]|nr:hypothetical protein B0H13DRAFT_1890103 [Mycena leptocephala]